MSSTCLPASGVLDGPLPRSRRHSLLSVPGVVVDSAGERWVGGASFSNEVTDGPFFFTHGLAGTNRVKEVGAGVDQPNFAAFTIYQPITCSTFSIDDEREFQSKAERVLKAVASHAVEEALAKGVDVNPFLADVNADVLVGGAQTPAAALGFLEDAIGVTGRAGMIHATPATASRWFGPPQEDGSPVLLTANGTQVAAGSGYIGATPSGEAAATAGQAWAYATGPVQVRLSEVLTHEDLSEAMDRAINEVTMRAEQYALVSWDQQLQGAVLVNWAA